MKKRKHLNENYNCASARLVRMVKYISLIYRQHGLSMHCCMLQECRSNMYDLVCSYRTIAVYFLSVDATRRSYAPPDSMHHGTSQQLRKG